MKPVNTKLRSINTKFWVDIYIVKLSPLERYLFLYLLTNSHTNLAGVYEIALETIASETKLKEREIEKIFQRFIEDKKIIYKEGFLIIKNFIKNQSFNNSMIKNVEKTIAQLPKEIREIYNDFVNPSTILDTMFTDSNSLSTASDKILSEDKTKSKIENKTEIEWEAKRGREKEKKENEGIFIDEDLKKTFKQIENKYNKPFARPVN